MDCLATRTTLLIAAQVYTRWSRLSLGKDKVHLTLYIENDDLSTMGI